MADGGFIWQEKGTPWKGVGIYHVTLAQTDRSVPLLGRLTECADPAEAKVERTELGNAIVEQFLDIPKHCPQVKPLAFCLMPDHLHGVIYVTSKQINTELSLEVAMDQVLKAKEQEAALAHFLGEDKCSVQTICGRKVFVYENDGKKFILLHKAITYLGNPHPIFKKRIQLPTWMQEFCENVKAQGLDYDVRLIGVYHYMNGVVFADFDKEPYLKRKMHNSSAHIYINDIFQAYKTAA